MCGRLWRLCSRRVSFPIDPQRILKVVLPCSAGQDFDHVSFPIDPQRILKDLM